MKREMQAILSLEQALLSPETHNQSGGPRMAGIVDAVNNYLFQMKKEQIPVPQSISHKILEMHSSKYRIGQDLMETAIRFKELLILCSACDGRILFRLSYRTDIAVSVWENKGSELRHHHETLLHNWAADNYSRSALHCR